MLKKIFLTVLGTWGCLCWSTNAQADLYFGADFSHTLFDYEDDNSNFADDYNNIGPVLGISIGPVGIEGYYKMSFDGTTDFGEDSELTAYGVDVLMALPMSEMVDFVASLGYSKYNLSYEQDGGDDFEIKGSGPRFGLGGQLHLTDHLFLRVMYHYTSLTSGIEDIKYINEFTAGLRYYF